MTRGALLISLTTAMAACDDTFVPDDIHEFVDVATGGDHTCAVTVDGEAFCWGRGADGELGTGDIANAFTPRAVQSNVRFKAITAGDAHTCALSEDGRAYCWGWTAHYQVGSALPANPRLPVPIDGNQRFTSISAGAHHTCGIAVDGRVFCWGYNRWGQNGNGITQTTVPAEATTGGLRASAISAGGFHTCALATNGAAFCWGSNQYGQLGIGADTLNSANPLPVKTALRFTRIDAGATHTCAIATDARVFCWGSAVYGEVGDGAPFKPGLPGPSTPNPVLLLGSATNVSAGVNQTCAVDVTVAASCWGRGTEGQLGNGNALDFPVRQPVRPLGKFVFTVLSTGGTTHACGINTGAVYCWGTGKFGQLGAGSLTISNVPQRISK
jgi:alpha-tubulin suppressor-like RCC1 family protein